MVRLLNSVFIVILLSHIISLIHIISLSLYFTSSHYFTVSHCYMNTFLRGHCWAYCPGYLLGVVSRALQNLLSKFVYRKNRTSYENFKLKICMCAQSHALGTHTKFQLEILTINGILGIVYFRKISLESSRNVSETAPWSLQHATHLKIRYP